MKTRGVARTTVAAVVLMVVLIFIGGAFLQMYSKAGGEIMDWLDIGGTRIKVVEKNFEIVGSEINYELKLQNIYTQPLTPKLIFSVGKSVYSEKTLETINPSETAETSGSIPIAEFSTSTCDIYCKTSGYGYGNCVREGGKETVGCLGTGAGVRGECSISAPCCCMGEKKTVDPDYLKSIVANKLIKIKIMDPKKCASAESDIKNTDDLDKLIAMCPEQILGSSFYELATEK